jgi:hypothetical protein
MKPNVLATGLIVAAHAWANVMKAAGLVPQ